MAINTINATIQMRKGLERDFDADQMTAGEWAVSTDKKYVRMCFAPGIVLRMATYEGFEEDMEEIQTILETCQDIKAAVELFEQLADQHATQAEKWSVESKSWAVGGTGTRAGEDANNSKYFSDLADALVAEAQKLLEQAQKVVAAATQGALIPVGTVAFSDLPTNPVVGYMYNISDDFITDDRFAEGPGIFYRAGANVYWTADGKWDVMIGTQVTGVKGDAEDTYHVGNVNITPASIGINPITAGHQLNLVDDVMGLKEYCTQITDWNSATKNGFYLSSGGRDVANAPGTSAYIGLAIVYASNYIHQIIWQISSNNNILSVDHNNRFERVKGNGVWGSWEETSVKQKIGNENQNVIPVAKNGQQDTNFLEKFREQTKGNLSNTNYISTFRADNSIDDYILGYGPGLAWGASNTHAYIMPSFNTEDVIIGAGQNNAINWHKKLAFKDDIDNLKARVSVLEQKIGS